MSMATEDASDIEADPDYDEVDSQYDSCYSSGSDNTTTIFSEVTNYRYEHGRRYHRYSEGHYWFPNDAQQNAQLDIFHHVYTLALDGRLHLAPLPKRPRAILDLGTGTGLWAVEAADMYPGATVLGNDLSPIQPAWIPANLSFEVDDFTKPWVHAPGTFTFVHARALYGSVADWGGLLREARAALHGGGWFESVETSVELYSEADGELPPGCAIATWTRLGLEAAARAGRPFTLVGKLAGWMRDAGFVDVRERVYKLPVGPWPRDRRMKELGRWGLLNLLEAAEGFTLALYTRVLGWTREETAALLVRVAEELKDKEKQLYFKMCVTYGKKPQVDSAYEPSSDEMDPREDGNE